VFFCAGSTLCCTACQSRPLARARVALWETPHFRCLKKIEKGRYPYTKCAIFPPPPIDTQLTVGFFDLETPCSYTLGACKQSPVRGGDLKRRWVVWLPPRRQPRSRLSASLNYPRAIGPMFCVVPHRLPKQIPCGFRHMRFTLYRRQTSGVPPLSR